MTDHERLREWLLTRARSETDLPRVLVSVKWTGGLSTARRAEKGQYRLRETPGAAAAVHASIEVHRVRASEPGDALDESLSLAHELGHVLDHKRGNHSVEGFKRRMSVQAALAKRAASGAAEKPDAPMPAIEERRAVYDAEARAWEEARRVLGEPEAGFDDWPAFEEARAADLATYYGQLQLDA